MSELEKSLKEQLESVINENQKLLEKHFQQDSKIVKLIEDNEYYKNQLQQKENIIKEVIEYHDNCVDDSLDLDKIYENERLAYKVAYEIHDNYLKILKEKNNG